MTGADEGDDDVDDNDGVESHDSDIAGDDDALSADCFDND